MVPIKVIRREPEQMHNPLLALLLLLLPGPLQQRLAQLLLDSAASTTTTPTTSSPETIIMPQESPISIVSSWDTMPVTSHRSKVHHLSDSTWELLRPGPPCQEQDVEPLSLQLHQSRPLAFWERSCEPCHGGGSPDSSGRRAE